MSAPITAERLAEIEARADAATPGPWTRQPSFSIDACIESAAMSSPMVTAVTIDLSGDNARNDAAFIEHARDDVPDLVAAVRERDEELARLRAQLAPIEAAARALAAREGQSVGFASPEARRVLDAALALAEVRR